MVSFTNHNDLKLRPVIDLSLKKYRNQQRSSKEIIQSDQLPKAVLFCMEWVATWEHHVPNKTPFTVTAYLIFACDI